MDAVKHILEAAHLRNEPQVNPNQPPVSDYQLLKVIIPWINK